MTLRCRSKGADRLAFQGARRLISLFGVVSAAVLVDRVILHPGQIIYQSHQVDSSGRSPNYEVTVETREAVRDLQQQLEERDNS